MLKVLDQAARQAGAKGPGQTKLGGRDGTKHFISPGRTALIGQFGDWGAIYKDDYFFLDMCWIKSLRLSAVGWSFEVPMGMITLALN